MNNKVNVKVRETETGTQIEQNLTQEMAYSKYEVKVQGCKIAVNDLVTPQTVIGQHYQTRQKIKATGYGQVATVFYNPMHDSLMIMIINAEADLAGETAAAHRYSRWSYITG